MSQLADSDELYIFGPAETKIKLKQKLQEDNRFSKILLNDVETADSMTQNQIIARIREYFKK